MHRRYNYYEVIDINRRCNHLTYTCNRNSFCHCSWKTPGCFPENLCQATARIQAIASLPTCRLAPETGSEVREQMSQLIHSESRMVKIQDPKIWPYWAISGIYQIDPNRLLHMPVKDSPKPKGLAAFSAWVASLSSWFQPSEAIFGKTTDS